MKGKWTLLGSILAVLLLALAAGLTRAQGPEPPGEGVQPEGEVSVQGVVGAVIPIQGRLTDASGNPVPDGNYNITARIYNVSSGGTALCSDTDPVHVSNGLFNMYIDTCTPAILNGQQLWLGIQVGSDTEMTPRRPIYPVPYAWSLRPGAVISDTIDGILTVRSTGTGDADALIAQAGGDGEAVTAYATDGVAVAAFSDNFLALQAYSYNNITYPAVFGCSADKASDCDPFRDDVPAGVFGYGTPGVYGRADWGYGVQGVAGAFGAGVKGEGNLIAYAGWFTNTDMTVLYITSGAEDARNAIYVDGGTNGEPDFRVTNAGTAYADGGWQGAADFAELIEAVDGVAYEPGDVLVISTASDRTVELSTRPYSTLVAGVYSARPGFIGSDHPMEERKPKELPLAVVGIVPCKVSAENGPIHRGDLLVTSSTPGHAMRAGPNPPQGTVLGKALGELEEGTGIILVLVTLQ